jgi:outer membrane biosynthesis protein TonB
VKDTPLISDKPSTAADLHEDADTGATPTPDVESENYLASRPAPDVPPTPPQQATPPAPKAPPAPKPPAAEPNATEESKLAARAEKEASPTEPTAPPPADKERPQPLLAPGGGGVQTRGLGAFEAHQDELAPYLLEVRKTVERHWRAALELRYSGTTPTAAVVDCAIRPDGSLAYVTVVEPGDSVSFGGLCQGAIEKAGPFAPFPFEVPDIYRSKDLEIRWTFNFM